MSRVSCLAGWFCLAFLLTGCGPNEPVGDSEKESRPPASSFDPDQSGKGPLKLLDDAPASSLSAAGDPEFVDVARARGLDFVYHSDTVPDRFYLPEIMGGGLGWLDFDGDGRLDLFVPDGTRLIEGQGNDSAVGDRLFRNTGEAFADVSAGSGIVDPGYGQGVAVGDFDADGFPDLFVANLGRNRLFRNQGDGSFREVTLEAGLSGEVWSSSCLMWDANSDGLLDLYEVNYLDYRPENYRICKYNGQDGYCGPGEYAGVQDRVWINDGEGGFLDQTESLGFTTSNGKGLAVVALDLDQDAVAEVYVANDMVMNFLFTRRDPFTGATELASGGRHTEVATSAGVASGVDGQPEASMGIAVGDLDGSGFPELFLTHFYSHKNTLYRNLKGLLFVDDSKSTGVARISLPFNGFGTIALDFDRDRDLDLFVTNGHVLGPNSPPERMTPQLYVNEGRAVFTDASSEAGSFFKNKLLGRSAASADFDNDGDLDLAVSHIGDPLALLENRSQTANSWLGVELFRPDRKDITGSRVEVSVAGVTEVRPVHAGGSYLASSDRRLLFGLGEVSGPIEVTVHWAGGGTDHWQLPAANQYWQLVPGSDPAPLSSLPE